jgi:uncharacterized coiled-coil DUF342 family protein
MSNEHSKLSSNFIKKSIDSMKKQCIDKRKIIENYRFEIIKLEQEIKAIEETIKIGKKALDQVD